MNANYLQTDTGGKKSYIRVDSQSKLKDATVLILDCDGVLIDIGESCNRAISETVAYIIRRLTGFPFSRSLVSKGIIHLFKESGGFNNDWDLTYGLLIFILSQLTEESQETLIKAINASTYECDLLKYFLEVQKTVIGDASLLVDFGDMVSGLKDELMQLAKKLDAKGLASLERELVSPYASKSFLKYYKALKRFLSYPGKVGESLPITVFEEIFCGSKLFRKMYKAGPRFYQGKGLIENERVIVSSKTLNDLVSLFGKSNIGVSSGRPFELAKYTLRDVLESFNPKALIFLDDITAAERKNSFENGSTLNLKKPNPFSLFASSGELEPFKFAIYVGDSMEDVMMIRNAEKSDPRFLFAGVYGYSSKKEDVLSNFLKSVSELVLPSVNELPVILKDLRERELI